MPKISDSKAADFLRFAYETAKDKSTDPSTQNGAVLLNGDSDVRSANFFPEGVKESKERWQRPLKYQYVEHAERNVIYLAAKKGIPTDGATMYCAWASCSDCARAIISAGVKELVTHHDPYADVRFGQVVSSTWKESIKLALGMLEEAGVVINWIDDKLFSDDFKILFNGILVSP